MPQPSSGSPTRRPPLPLIAGFAVFLAAIAYLIVASMVPRDVPTFEPTTFVRLAANGDVGLHASAGVIRSAEHAEFVVHSTIDTITIDAADPEAWRYFSFRTRALLEAPDTAGWDLAVRRYHVRVRGAAADLGPADSLSGGGAQSSLTDAAFENDDGRDDAGHPAIRRWYRYGMFTHLLESKRHAYLVRASDGKLARIEVLSYYCPGPRPGCMTFRYAYPLGDGDT